jgi:hypothetical protein
MISILDVYDQYLNISASACRKIPPSTHLDPRPGEGLRIDPQRGGAVEFFDGGRFGAYAGESIACALFAAGVRTRQKSAHLFRARDVLSDGSCQECVVEADGRRVAACRSRCARARRTQRHGGGTR